MKIVSYLAARGLTQAQFAAEIGVSVQSMYRYIHEGRVPTPLVMARIIQTTDGKVTPNDFHEGVTPACGGDGERAA